MSQAPRSARQRGFTLVEILVAVVLLALGLLGMAGLQMSVLRANESARLRTIATHASYDLADRIRADPEAIFDGLESKQTGISGADCAGAGPSGTDARARWHRDFCAFGLPAPRDGSKAAAVDCTSQSACGQGNCEIIVRWDDSRGDQRNAAPDDTAFRVCTRLPVR